MIRALVLVLVAGCAEHIELASGALPGLVSIDVAPASSTLAIALPSAVQSVAFTATGHFENGTTRDITDAVTWTTDNSAPGAFTAATYTTSNTAAGHVAIAAVNGNVHGSAALTVTIALTVVDDGFPPPAGSSDGFETGTPVVDPMKSPVIAYPADHTGFPQGLAPVLMQYQRSPMTDAFRLAFESDVLDLHVLTGSDRWRPDPDLWNLIERSHPAASLTFEVDAVTSTAPGTIYTGSQITLAFAPNDPGGALYYDASGVVRTQLSSTSAPRLYPPAGDATPTSNPSVSRDGQLLALEYGGHLRVVELDPVLARANTNAPMGWAAISPDGTSVVISNMGMLSLRDAITGAGVGSPDGRIMMPGMATHPDWSPSGDAIAVATGTGVNNADLKGGSIVRVPYLGDNHWGPPQILVASTSDNDNNYFPRWSPDGHWIAYVHADGPAKDAPSAELRLVAATGGPPIVLARASHQLGLTASAANLANTMPAWGPDGATTWLAFATSRPYGVVRPTAGSPQIWIAAIDLTLAGDPSSAAMWLPAQDVTASNTTPAWALFASTTARQVATPPQTLDP
jgi:hypothetical protein